MTRQNFLSEKQKQNCKKALDQMPDEFSSRTFNKAARLIGEPDAWTNADQSWYFLKFNCTIIKGTKSWRKNSASNLFNNIIKENKNDIINYNIDDAIKFLLNTGKYKIYVKTEEFKEII